MQAIVRNRQSAALRIEEFLVDFRHDLFALVFFQQTMIVQPDLLAFMVNCCGFSVPLRSPFQPRKSQPGPGWAVGRLPCPRFLG